MLWHLLELVFRPGGHGMNIAVLVAHEFQIGDGDGHRLGSNAEEATNVYDGLASMRVRYRAYLLVLRSVNRRTFENFGGQLTIAEVNVQASFTRTIGALISARKCSETFMIVCVGGAVLDRKYRAKAQIVMATSNPVDGFRSFGGVGRNICENLARLGVETAFISIVGDDENGRAIVDHLGQAGADISGVRFSATKPTAEYVAILEPSNDLALGIADMSVFEELTPDVIEAALDARGADDWLLFDCNLPEKTIAWLAKHSASRRYRLACDTVSTIKAKKIGGVLDKLDLIFTNYDEARALTGSTETDDTLARMLRDAGVGAVVLTRGANGLLIADSGGVRSIAAVPSRPVDVTGAGDALVAGTLAALAAGRVLDEAARDGALLAALTIENPASVLPDLSPGFLSAARARIPVETKETAQT